MAAGPRHRAGHAPRLTPVPPLHVVTDDHVLAHAEFEDAAAAILGLGAGVALHLRGHGTSGRRLHALATALLPVARATGARLLVNDRVDVALAAGADGVVLGHGSLPPGEVRRLRPDAWIGASIRADEAPPDGTDFVLLGTIYRTPTHPTRDPDGVAALATAAARLRVPVIAIGGIDRPHVRDVARAGAAGFAVIGAVWKTDEPAAAAAGLLEEWNAVRRDT